MEKTIKNIIKELEEELEQAEFNLKNGKYKTKKDKDLCELIYNTRKNQIINDLKIIKYNIGV